MPCTELEENFVQWKNYLKIKTEVNLPCKSPRTKTVQMALINEINYFWFNNWPQKSLRVLQDLKIAVINEMKQTKLWIIKTTFRARRMLYMCLSPSSRRKVQDYSCLFQLFIASTWKTLHHKHMIFTLDCKADWSKALLIRTEHSLQLAKHLGHIDCHCYENQWIW